MSPPNRPDRSRGVSPVVGVALLVAIVVLLAVTMATLAIGLTQSQIDSAERVALFDDEQCPGFQAFEYEPPEFDDVYAEISENNCALWLEAGAVETDGDNRITAWRDMGPNGFDATQATVDDRPTVEHDSELGHDVVVFDGQNEDTTDPADNDGQYLRLNRNVDELNIDEDSGLVVASVIEVESFNRGATWTVGEAGVDGREFSMRTCSSFDVDECQHGSPGGEWRAQHWGTEDIDFTSSATDGGWVTLVHAYDGGEVEIRINGETIATEAVELDLSANRDIQLGRWERESGDPHWYYDGKIAELLIFDQALNDGEIENVEGYLDAKFDTGH